MANLTNLNNKFLVTTGGNVGIGATGPQGALHVYSGTSERFLITGDVHVQGSTDLNINGTSRRLSFTAGTGTVRTTTGNNLYLQTNSTTVLELKSNLVAEFTGNVGIGTGNPTSPTSVARFLSIEGSTAGIVLSDSSDSNYKWDIWNSSGGLFMKYNDTTFGIAQLSNGNVGIGTTSPAYKLQVSGTQNANDIVINNTTTGVNLRLQMIDANGAMFTTGSKDLLLGTNNTERMRIDSSGNVGIGVTSPGSKLTVDGVIELDESSGAHGFINTDGTNYEFDINRNPMTGAISDSAKACARIAMRAEDGGAGSRIIFATAAANNTTATERARIDKSGNLGIGTTAPNKKLTVYGGNDNGIWVDSSGSQYTSVAWGNNGSEKANIAYDNTNANFALTAYGASNTLFTNNGSERMRITSAGNVGIGTTSPTYKLHIDSDDANDDVVFIHHDNAAQSSGTLLKIRTDAGDSNGYTLLDVQTNSGSALFVRGDRNVGIGTASPSSLLHLQSASSPTLRIVDTTNSATLLAYAQNSDAHIGTYSSHDLIFDSNSTQRMRIKSGGYIGMNTSPSGFATLEIENIASTTYGLYVDYIDTNGSYGAMKVILTGASTSPSYVDWWYGATQTGAVVTTGSSTQYLTSSDYRLKENIVPMSNAVDRVMQLKPSRFNFIGHENTVDGLIAHEVAEIVPEAVNGEKDGLRDDGTPKYQGIDEGKLVPLLIGAIQELEARVKELENK